MNSPTSPTPLAAASRIWAAHSLLQLYVQQFLFPDSWRPPLCLLSCALMLTPSRPLLAAALIARNAARYTQMPFVWDSEFWWCRAQLALCYAASGFFKLNEAFLDSRVSCAPIFGLSLLERIPPLATALKAAPGAVGVLAALMPPAVIAVELWIAALLARDRWSSRGVLLALIFHAAIALTPPPNGARAPPPPALGAATGEERLLLWMGVGE
ncbi:hypothetical protein EMIHUDRAFT_212008 [Emiliania huxleyi CCMP1516]|uniref:HTTM domain-containing protein n=2 Tax=Emiliania huxleyi TaxID=2903 RepID=A0A0D3IS23_EMIH1|nr:hypothetical protein EMIHUDRAFT_212008 [Emiliania huxleyi CCMP1516]EOD14058.1 hypothetical protein EMIHUDRAFT_212008 [Emiliania huxleyi CCMP1516]|eukprot:XP_005766487.1 hypothetical protein EMIHUDRAFT_212008 [Emiliania huxleyi CCMP1516]